MPSGLLRGFSLPPGLYTLPLFLHVSEGGYCCDPQPMYLDEASVPPQPCLTEGQLDFALSFCHLLFQLSLPWSFTKTSMPIRKSRRVKKVIMNPAKGRVSLWKSPSLNGSGHLLGD